MHTGKDPTGSPGGQVWLITGCSSGFGRELVLAATSRGDRVIATARRTQDLDYCQSIGNVKVLQLDVTASQAELSSRIRDAIQIYGGIDILVNNAGYVLSGVWEELRSRGTFIAPSSTPDFD